MNPVFDKYGLKELLPPKVDIPEEGCVRLNKSQYCFESGERKSPSPLGALAISEIYTGCPILRDNMLKFEYLENY